MNNKPSRIILTLVAIILLIALLVWGLNWISERENNNSNVGTNETASIENQQTEDNLNNDDLVSMIAASPSEYYGQTVTVEGSLQNVHERRLYRLNSQFTGDGIVVVTRQAFTNSQARDADEYLEDNPNTLVTGEIRQMTVAEIENEFTIDIPEAAEADLQNKPVLIAERFSFANGEVVFDFPNTSP